MVAIVAAAGVDDDPAERRLHRPCHRWQRRRGLHESLQAVDGADVLFVGPTDLSYNMGIRDQLESAQFVDALTKVSEAAKKHGKAAGILVHNNALVPKVRELGYTFTALGSDGGAVRAGLLGFVAALKGK